MPTGRKARKVKRSPTQLLIAKPLPAMPRNRLKEIETLTKMIRIQLFFFNMLLLIFLGCIPEKNPPASLAINLDDVEWGEAGDGSIAPAGTRTALQSTNPVTGGISYYTWFPAGVFFDEHWHTHDEYVVLISGKVTIKLGKEIYDLNPGAFIVIPGGMPHYWDIPETGDAIILAKRDGPPDFHFVNR